jgi:Trk-type K+ transport system membrane component
VHSKLTVMATVILLTVGFVSYLALEWDNPRTLGQFSGWEKLLPAFFSGAMPRTGGLNSIDIGALNSETLFVTDILMFIGGGSGGTAGGVKVTTFFLLGFVIWAEVRAEPDVSIFRRRISHAVQRQALTVALLGVACAALGTTLLLFITDFSLDRVLFEALSAFGTVGLSTGITPELGAAGQTVLIALMYIGRVGTVAVAAAMALRVGGRLYRYPEERPIVG